MPSRYNGLDVLGREQGSPLAASLVRSTGAKGECGLRITDIETFLVTYRYPERDYWWGGAWEQDFVGLRFNGVILRVQTDEGLSGLGEAMPWGDCRALEATIHRLKPRFVGRDPFDVALLTVPGADATSNYALAGIDVALWDIVGKATGTPVYRLLAGDGDTQPKGIRTYASGGVSYAWFLRPEQVIDEALEHRQNGFTAFKMRIGSAWGTSGVTVARFADLLERVRVAIGPEMDLMLDANCRFRTAEEAIEVARVLESLKVRWFEEPLPYAPAGAEAYNRVRAGTHVPISGGEGFNSLESMQTMLRARAYDIVQPDATFVGMTRAYRVACLYHSLGRPCIPHSWTTGIAQAANAHLVAAIPNRVMLEIQQVRNPLMTEIVDRPIPVNQGFIDVPDRPGLGIELNEDALRQFPFDDNGIWMPYSR